MRWRRSRRERSLRRAFWTVVLLSGGLAIVAGLRIGIPYAMINLGVGADYGWSMFRIGHREARYLLDLTGDWPEGTSYHRRKTSGPIFAKAGERLVLLYNVAPRRGQLTMILDEALGGGMTPIWRAVITEAAEGAADIEIPETGFYNLRLMLTDYKGDVEVDWRVK